MHTCASAHYITQNLAEKLRLPIKPDTVPASVINDMKTFSKGSVGITFETIHSDYNKRLSFL